MWYSIPTDKAEQKQALEIFFHKDKQGHGKKVAALLEAYSDPDDMTLASNGKQLFSLLLEAYQNAGIVKNDSTVEEVFPEQTPAAFRKAFATLWHTLSCKALCGTAYPVDEVIETVLQIADALEEQKRFSRGNVESIFENLLDMWSEYDDAYYANMKEGDYDPVVIVDRWLGGDEKEAEAISEALKNGEIHAKDYVNSRLKLMQRGLDSELDSFAPLFPFYDPRTMESGKEAPAEEIQSYDGELKAAREKLAEARKGFAEPMLQSRLAMQNIDPMLLDINQFMDIADQSSHTKFAPEYVDGFWKKLQETQRQMEYKLQTELADTSYAYNQLMDENTEMLRRLRSLTKKTETAESAQAAEKAEEYWKQLASCAVKESIPRFDEAVMDRFTDAKEQIWDIIFKNYNAMFGSRYAMVQANDRIKEILKDQNQLALKMETEKLATPERLKEMAEQQEAINKALEEQVTKLQQAQRELDGLLPDYFSKLTDARNKLTEIESNALQNDFNEKYIKQLKAEDLKKKQDMLPALRENLAKVKEEYDNLKMSVDREDNLQALADVFHAVSDSKERNWYGAVKKTPQAYAEMKAAMETYLQNQTEANAEKAYAECRNYLSANLKPDGSGLKHGSNLENARNQSVVRMLEIMENIKEFRPFVDQKQVQQQREMAEVNGLADWELMMDAKTVKQQYNKLNFKDLEKSLAKHSSKVKGKQKNAEDPQKEKAFSDLNKHMAKKAKQNKVK